MLGIMGMVMIFLYTSPHFMRLVKNRDILASDESMEACQCNTVNNHKSSKYKSSKIDITEVSRIQKYPQKHDHFKDVDIRLEQKYRINAANDYMFPFIINNPHVCVGRVHHMIIVVSAPSHTEKRKALRKTWAQINLLDNYPSRTIFVFGNTYQEDIQEELVQESKVYHDIIQADFEESYHNITMKVLVGIKWVLTFCRQAWYVVRTNDDVFVHMTNLIQVLTSKHAADKRSIFGQRTTNATMFDFRVPKPCGKMCVASHDHKHLRYYPPYIHGSFYVITADILQELYTTAISIIYFWIEDVYLAGFVVQAMVNVTQVDWSAYYQYDEWIFMKQLDTQSRQFVSSTNTFYGIWATTLLNLSPKHKMLIGSKNKFIQVYDKFTRNIPN